MGRLNTEPSSSAKMYAPPVARNDYEWSNIARPHLAIEGFLDSCIADEDEVARFTSVIDKGS